MGSTWRRLLQYRRLSNGGPSTWLAVCAGALGRQTPAHTVRRNYKPTWRAGRVTLCSVSLHLSSQRRLWPLPLNTPRREPISMRKAARTVIWSSGGIASCALDVGRLCLALMAFEHMRAVARPHLLHRRRCTANLLRVGVGWGGGVCGAHRVCDHRTLRATCTYALVYLPHVLRNLSLQPCKKPM